MHIHASRFDYRGCLKTTGPQQLQLSQDVWQQAGEQSDGPADLFMVELTVLGASGPIGPIEEQLVIAQATLKGSIYYDSYSGVGAIFRIPPGGKAELFFGGTACCGYHSVSANGARRGCELGEEVCHVAVSRPARAAAEARLARAPRPHSFDKENARGARKRRGAVLPLRQRASVLGRTVVGERRVAVGTSPRRCAAS